MPTDEIKNSGSEIPNGYYTASNERFSWPAIRPIVIGNTVFVWGAYGTSDLIAAVSVDEFIPWLISNRKQVARELEKKREARKPSPSLPINFDLDDFVI